MEQARGHCVLLVDALVPFDTSLQTEEVLEVRERSLEETRYVSLTIVHGTVVRLVVELGCEMVEVRLRVGFEELYTKKRELWLATSQADVSEGDDR